MPVSGNEIQFEKSPTRNSVALAPPLIPVCGTELQFKVSTELDTLVSKSYSDTEVVFMNNIIYIVGAVVIVLVILSFVGLV
jgi:hypothetical protein